MVNSIHFYIENGNEAEVKKWLGKCTDIDEVDANGQSPLHVAAYHNQINICKLLVKRGADCNVMDKEKWTPLHCAASPLNFEVCQIIIKSGRVDVNIPTPSGTSVLNYICRANSQDLAAIQEKTIKMLIREGAEIDAFNKFKETALHQACQRSNKLVSQILLESHADPNTKNMNGESPLIYAINSNSKEIVEELLRAGADPLQPTNSGTTAFDIAKKLNLEPILKLLEQHRLSQSPWKLLENIKGKFPISRAHHSSQIVNNRICIFGGQDQDENPKQLLGDLFLFNTMSLEWRQAIPQNPQLSPGAITGQGSVIRDSKLFLFCGRNFDAHTGGVWCLDLDNMRWEDLAIKGSYKIRPRAYHSATLFDETRVVVFGGSCDGEFFSDLHIFDLNSATWSRVTAKGKPYAPSKRHKHSATLVGRMLYIFGGTDGQDFFYSIHALDLDKWEWKPVNCSGAIPSGRHSHATVPLNNVLLTFGGRTSDRETSDFFAFDIASETWVAYGTTQFSSDLQRAGHSLSITNLRVFLYGGGAYLAIHELLPHVLEQQVKPPIDDLAGDKDSSADDKTVHLTTQNNGTSSSDSLKLKKVLPDLPPNRPSAPRKRLSQDVNLLQLEVQALIQLVRTEISNPESAALSKCLVIEKMLKIEKRSSSPSVQSPIIPARPISAATKIPSVPSASLPPIVTSSSESPRMGFSGRGRGEGRGGRGGRGEGRGGRGGRGGMAVTEEAAAMPFVPPRMRALSTGSTDDRPVGLGARRNVIITSLEAESQGPPKKSTISDLKKPGSSRNHRPSPDTPLPLGALVATTAGSSSPTSTHSAFSVPAISVVPPVRTENSILSPRGFAPTLTIRHSDESLADMGSLISSNRSISGSNVVQAKKAEFSMPAPPLDMALHFYDLLSHLPKIPLDLSAATNNIGSKHRQDIINELLQTEDSYIKDLCVIIGIYKRNLENHYQGLISDHYMAMIFSNVEPLLESSTQLFRGLIEQLSLPDFKQTIGQCFLQNMAELERYIFYCTRHSDATEMVEKFLKEEHFPIFCELAKSTKESKSLDILSYLIKPFQRICRYKLLLAEILKHTPKEWADYKSIELACAKLNRIVSKANEEQRVSDTIQKMIDIQNSFIWTDGEDQIKWSPNSTYVTEGGLKLLNSKGQTQKRYFFLFNDMLVISEQKGAKHIKKAVIPTNQVVIWDLPDTGSRAKFGFQIVRLDSPEKYSIVFSKLEEKNRLLGIISDQISM